MSLTWNKIAASVLMSGILAMVSGIIAGKLVSPVPLAKNVYEVAVAPAAAPPAKEGEAKEEGPEAIAPLMASADPAHGQTLTKACTLCHTFDKGGANKIGP
ncbi:MAG TPA: cytochrome c family protein, partial [Stellaceae bacterium]|nr:cytochrome c family protein [Stellaceae bacterium]